MRALKASGEKWKERHVKDGASFVRESTALFTALLSCGLLVIAPPFFALTISWAAII